MVPKHVGDVTFRQAEGWRKFVSEPEPLFKISTQTFSGTEWLIERSYSDFELLRQYLLE
jgi:hypothetical protein